MVRDEVVPRLHAALSAPLAGRVAPAEARSIRARPALRSPLGERTARDEVLAFAKAMLADDIEGASARVAVLRAGGQSLESIFLHVFAPTACHLRDLWSDDLCGSADVTLAICNLRTLMRHHAAAFEANGSETGRRALIVSATPAGGIDVGLPLFELTMAAQFFRREGWQPRIECGLYHPAVRQAARGEWFDLVTILASNAGRTDGDTMDGEQLAAMAAGIRTIRREAPNRALGVIVCGSAFVRSPELVARVGADCAARDAATSLAQAGRLVARAAGQRCDASSKPRRRRRLP